MERRREDQLDRLPDVIPPDKHLASFAVDADTNRRERFAALQQVGPHCQGGIIPGDRQRHGAGGAAPLMTLIVPWSRYHCACARVMRTIFLPSFSPMTTPPSWPAASGFTSGSMISYSLGISPALLATATSCS